MEAGDSYIQNLEVTTVIDQMPLLPHSTPQRPDSSSLASPALAGSARARPRWTSLARTALTLATVAILSLATAPAFAASLPKTPKPPDDPLNLLFITIDTWRWDYLGAAGTDKVATPNLDALAREGLLFSNTRAAAPVTLVSHASLFTGVRPTHHGVHHNGTFVLTDEHETLAEVLQGRGYQTTAVTGAYVVSSRYGLHQGFDNYLDVLPGSLYGDSEGLEAFYPEITADQVSDRALHQLQQFTPQQPWFLWLHYFDPHADYAAPERFTQRYPRDPYAAEVAFVDEQIGRVVDYLKARGQWGDTAVVLTADHGESLGEHGEITHGHFIYDATTRVATLVRVPGTAGGRSFEQRVRGIDLMPTALGVLGLPVPAAVQGDDLRPLWQHQRASRRAAYSETFLPYYDFGWGYLRSLELDGWKYVLAPKPELYNLDADPNERQNLVEREPERAAHLRDTLLRLIEQSARTAATGTQTSSSTEERDALASLGYLGGGTHPMPADTEDELQALPDPKDRIHLEEDLARAWAAQAKGNLRSARRILDRILEEDPHNTAVLRFASAVNRELGDWDRALQLLSELGRYWPSEAWRHDYLQAYRLRQDGDVDGAARLYNRLLDTCQESSSDAAPQAEKCVNSLSDLVHLQLEAERTEDARTTLARYRLEGVQGISTGERLRHANLFTKAGQPQQAESYLQGLRNERPDVPDIHLALSNLYREQNRFALAVAALQQALEVDPTFLPALNNLATLYGARGDLETSNHYLQRVLDLDARNSRALGNLAVNRLQQGQTDEAIRLLQRAVDSDGRAINPRLNLARLYLQRNQVREAVALCRQVIDLQPGNELALQVLQRFGRAG